MRTYFGAYVAYNGSRKGDEEGGVLWGYGSKERKVDEKNKNEKI